MVDCGNQVMANATGFVSGESLQIWLHCAPIKLLSTTASAGGTLSKTGVILSDVTGRAHEMGLHGASSDSTREALAVTDGLAVTCFGSASIATIEKTTIPETRAMDAPGSRVPCLERNVLTHALCVRSDGWPRVRFVVH